MSREPSICIAVKIKSTYVHTKFLSRNEYFKEKAPSFCTETETWKKRQFAKTKLKFFSIVVLPTVSDGCNPVNHVNYQCFPDILVNNMFLRGWPRCLDFWIRESSVSDREMRNIWSISTLFLPSLVCLTVTLPSGAQIIPSPLWRLSLSTRVRDSNPVYLNSKAA